MKKWTFTFFLFLPVVCFSQLPMQPKPIFSDSSSYKNTVFKKREWLVGGASALVYGGSFIFLNKAWYKGYPRSSFHTFNDGGEWLQMDKVGHAWTAYTTSRLTTRAWQWAGVGHNTSLLLGTGTSLLYMLSIEYLDGRSAEWGWSWPDAGADVFGAALFAVQETGWKQQRIQLKFSSYYKKYTSAALQQRANDIYGKSLAERLLKDYNAQTYWLSFNINSFFKTKKLPSWLNIAIGYGANGMFGGYQNIAYDKNGAVIFDRRDIKRYRQWYLAPDIDLTKIKTKSKLLKTFFDVFTLVIPVPSLEFSNKKFKFNISTF